MVTPDALSAREEIEKALDERRYVEAAKLLRLWMRQPLTANQAMYVASQVERLRGHLPLTPCRLAIVRSFTIEPIVPFLRAQSFATGLDTVVQVGNFNTYAQDFLDFDSSLYRFGPDVVIVAVRTADLLPAIWAESPLSDGGEWKRKADHMLTDCELWIKKFRTRSRAHIILHNFEMPAYMASGIIDGQSLSSQKGTIVYLNEGLKRLVTEYPGVYVFDYDALVARHGRLNWFDPGKWLSVRMPIAAPYIHYLAEEYVRYLCPLMGKLCKVLAVDLDNTLWGGIIGEDGIDGIQLGVEYPGAAYISLQRVIMNLYRRGILLAICSKNNSEDALNVLENHPSMLLRPKHFASIRTNWQDKALNLREIAAELNIGLDAVAFLDDNPVERERVRDALPEVVVIELPENCSMYAQELERFPMFERLAVSSEDAERGRYYREQRERSELQRNVASLDDFLRSLEMRAQIVRPAPGNVARIAQLTQKTNQFNLTTRRYSEQDVVKLSNDAECEVYGLRLADRFGDNGIVGVAILRYKNRHCEIDSFLLSCRVIGRTVETAFLSYLAGRAQAKGAGDLRGWYLKTKKNKPAEDFYEKHGFRCVRIEEDGSEWEANLGTEAIARSKWIEVHEAT